MTLYVSVGKGVEKLTIHPLESSVGSSLYIAGLAGFFKFLITDAAFGRRAFGENATVVYREAYYAEVNHPRRRSAISE
jgi:hypothetical protein